MSVSGNFVYDSEGNLIEDKSKSLKISYDWRGMPVEFVHDVNDVKKAYKLMMAYDGSGRRISKTRLRRDLGASDWAVENVTHYTGIGTEVRETHVNGQDETKVVVNMPNGLGRYQPEDAVDGLNGVSGSQLAGYRPPAKFEWYLKNHIGSTMLVYGTSAYNDPFNSGYKGGVKAAYDYRATVVAMRTKQQVAKCCPPFGEQVSLAEPTDKVTENFTGKEKDDETELNYFGARYLDPMLGLWTSVDPARQFSSPYLYVGNGVNPVNVIDPDGNAVFDISLSLNAYIGVGGGGKFGVVINTNDLSDCGIVYGYSFGGGLSFSMSPSSVLAGAGMNLTKSTAQSLDLAMDISGVGSNMFKSALMANTAHDLENVQLNASFAFLVGSSFELGKNPLTDGPSSIDVGQFGVKASLDVTKVLTIGDVLGKDDGRSLLPTSGPSPADNSNVATYQEKFFE